MTKKLKDILTKIDYEIISGFDNVENPSIYLSIRGKIKPGSSVLAVKRIRKQDGTIHLLGFPAVTGNRVAPLAGQLAGTNYQEHLFNHLEHLLSPWINKVSKAPFQKTGQGIRAASPEFSRLNPVGIKL